MTTAFDILLRGGMVADGSGAPARRADVGIRGDRIAAVGTIPPAAPAALTLDVAGLLVCPGFIDAHSHSDAYLLVAPDAPAKVRQGVTTEVIGQCGTSLAPLLGAARLPADWQAVLDAAGLGDCRGPLAAYRERLAADGHAVNVVCLVGHNTLRAAVTGYAARHATPAEIAAMGRLLEEALDEGAAGFSTGLIYTPGLYAAPEEVRSLARLAAARGAIHATHMRSEGARLLEALDETLALARETGIRTQISHLKTAGKANWSKLDAALAKIRAARAAGLPVAADRYPYLASGTSLASRLPDWARADGDEAVLARLNDPPTAARIAAEIAAAGPPERWEDVMIGGTSHPDLRRWRGRTVAEAARGLGCEPVEAFLRILRLDRLFTEAFFFGMSADNMRRIYAEPWVMVGSDASVRAIEGPLAADHPHPRAYGAFVRFLRLARDGELGIPLEEAIRRLTLLPAETFGLQGRGRIAPDARADLTVLDPPRLRDTATFAEPHRYAEGVCCTIVNGRIAFDGRQARARAGRWLTTRAAAE